MYAQAKQRELFTVTAYRDYSQHSGFNKFIKVHNMIAISKIKREPLWT